MFTELIGSSRNQVLKRKTSQRTEPFRPGKLKNTSGPFRCGICFSTFSSLAEWRGHLPFTAFIAPNSSFSSFTDVLDQADLGAGLQVPDALLQDRDEHAPHLRLQVRWTVIEQLEHVFHVLRVLHDEVQLHVEFATDELHSLAAPGGELCSTVLTTSRFDTWPTSISPIRTANLRLSVIDIFTTSSGRLMSQSGGLLLRHGGSSHQAPSNTKYATRHDIRHVPTLADEGGAPPWPCFPFGSSLDNTAQWPLTGVDDGEQNYQQAHDATGQRCLVPNVRQVEQLLQFRHLYRAESMEAYEAKQRNTHFRYVLQQGDVFVGTQERMTVQLARSSADVECAEVREPLVLTRYADTSSATHYLAQLLVHRFPVSTKEHLVDGSSHDDLLVVIVHQEG
uniref:Uncharacterized protein n=1 Tax=Anopheles farauti TaxID=69004 RepID=A0A182PZT6_9DIPT